MLRTMHTPDDLDADGTRLWAAYFDLRQREHAAQVAYGAARVAMRRQRVTATPKERGHVLQCYRDASGALEEIVEARKAAERQYHAYRRVLVVRTQMQPHSCGNAVTPLAARVG